jgi:hypothetical protein
MTEESNTEESKKYFDRPKRLRLFSNELDIDTKLTDMQGNTIVVIPAGCSGTFVESQSPRKMKPNDREKLKDRIADIIDKTLEYSDCDTITSEEIAEKIMKEIEK